MDLNIRKINLIHKAVWSKMKKTAILLVALVVLFFGCLSPQSSSVVIRNETGGNIQKNETVPIKINATGDCTDLLDSSMRDNCYMNKITKGMLKDVSICYKITDEKLRDRCIYTLALENIELCPQISSVSLNLRDDCFYSHAESTGNEATCFRIRDPELLKKCQGAIADKACAGLDEYNTTLCLALKTRNPALCASSVNHSQECFWTVAKNFSDSSICGNLTSQATSRACEAVITNNVDLCADFTFNTTSDGCYQLFAIDKNNPAICDKTVTETYITSCHQALALMNNRPDLCSHAVSEPERDQCYKAVAIKHLTADVCNSIKEAGVSDRCKIEVAKAVPDAVICGLVNNSYQRNYQCYTTIIASKDYPITMDMCSRISTNDLQWKDECYARMAKELGNSTICNLIQTEGLKARCG